MGLVRTALCIMGTRPEVIKMAPVVRALEKKGFHVPILATAQHRHLLDQVLAAFALKTQWDLDAMRPNQTLSGLVARILPGLEDIIHQSNARVVIAQGDTTTVLCAALAAFHAQIPFAHVEAGLRSGHLDAPFPEEGNRRLASVLANYHFAPTARAREALLDEGVPCSLIHVVGNTVIDALLGMVAKEELPWPVEVPRLLPEEKLVLITLHRRENFGEPFQRIFSSIRVFAEAHPGTRFVYPMHPNPNVLGPAREALAGVSNLHLIEPLEYPAMVALLRASYAVFTDSGGLQEEGPALGKPVLVFREVTERPEALETGGVRLVGSNPASFLDEASQLWNNPSHYAAMATPSFPYGDGTAAWRIAEILDGDLGQA